MQNLSWVPHRLLTGQPSTPTSASSTPGSRSTPDVHTPRPPGEPVCNGVCLALAVTASSLAALSALPATAPATAAVALNDSEVTANLWEWNWRSVASACTDHLGPAGYGAVQVAPPQESISLPTSADGVHPWYEVYQPVSYRLDSRSAPASSSPTWSPPATTAGVRVYVDAVVNHMAGANNAHPVVGYAGTDFSGPGYSFPGRALRHRRLPPPG